MPELHGVDFHPVFQDSKNINWGLVPEYPLMAVKFTESIHVGTWEAQAGRDFLIMRRRKEAGKHKYIMGYHWLTSRESPKAQVDNFARFVRKYIGAFEPGESYQLDYETTPYAPLPVKEWAEEFMLRAKDTLGIDGILYCSDWLPDSPADADQQGEFIEWRRDNPTVPLWYANYSLSSGYTGGTAEVAKFGADIWQWSSTQTVPGFPTKNNIDMNMIMPRGWDTLDRICRIHKPAPFPKPVSGLAKENDMTTLVIAAPSGANARFLATADGKGFIGSMTWIQKEEDYNRLRQYYAEVVIEADAPRNIGLIGPVPHGDTLRNWSIEDFLNAPG